MHNEQCSLSTPYHIAFADQLTTMTTDRQRSRSPVEGQEQRAVTGWTQLFLAKQETEQQSLTFVKKLVSATMSTVTYVRNVFDQKAYTKSPSAARRS